MADRRPCKLPISLAFFLLFTSHSTSFIISPLEKSALIHLRTSLALRNADWPTNFEPCIYWKGIECTNGSVSGINLSLLNRTRKGMQNPNFAVDGLQNLTMLSSFKASNFPLPGPIPVWFGQIRFLQVLDLSSCSINGSIPWTLGDLINLTALDLSDNNLVGMVPSGLFRLPWLTVMDLSQNSLTGPIGIDPGSISRLVYLDMSSNNLSGPIPPWIGSLSILRHLDLSGNVLSSFLPIELNSLSKLVDLNLGSNALSGSVPDNIWITPSLEFLNLSRNNFTGALPDMDSGNESDASCDISHNALYGYITPVIKRFRFAVLSWNYLEGSVPQYATKVEADFGANCLKNVKRQRNATECRSFYEERKMTFEAVEDEVRMDGEDHKGLWGRVGKIVGYIVFVVFVALMFWVCLVRMGH